MKLDSEVLEREIAAQLAVNSDGLTEDQVAYMTTRFCRAVARAVHLWLVGTGPRSLLDPLVEAGADTTLPGAEVDLITGKIQ